MTRVELMASPAFQRMQLIAVASSVLVAALCAFTPTEQAIVAEMRLVTIPVALLTGALFVVTHRRFARLPAFELDGGRIILRKGPFITVTRQTQGPIEAAAHGRSTRLTWTGGSLVVDGRMVSQQALLAALKPQG